MEVQGSGARADARIPHQRRRHRHRRPRSIRCGSSLEPASGGLKPYLLVRGRLEALVTRALYYDLVELAVTDEQRASACGAAARSFHAGGLKRDAVKGNGKMLKDPPLLTIRRKFERPSRELIAKLAGAQTGHVVDALYGRGALEQARQAGRSGARAASSARALTCESGANDNLAIMAALVIAAAGRRDHRGLRRLLRPPRCVGDNLAIMAKNKGVVAIVTDGMARDREGIVGGGPAGVRARHHAQLLRAERARQAGLRRSCAAASPSSRVTWCWATATAW